MENESLSGHLTEEEAESFFGMLYIITYLLGDNIYHLQSIDFSLSQEECDTMIFGLASKHFEISNIFPFQLGAVSAAISGCDSLVIQPTGKGKSLCFQLVALQKKQLVLVFVPTLALCV